MNRSFIIIFLILIFHSVLQAQERVIVVQGSVVEKITGNPISAAQIRFAGSTFQAESNPRGNFVLHLPQKEIYQLFITHLGYNTILKELKRNGKDTLQISIGMEIKPRFLDTIAVLSKQVPETLVGKPNYSIFDFDFYEDKFILLTSEGSLEKAQVQLSDYRGKILSYYKLPKNSGKAQRFFHDYEGYTELICADTVFRIDVFNTDLLIGGVPRKSFENSIKPVMDTLNDQLYYSNQWDKYPSFNYYYLKPNDSISRVLSSITNEDLLKMYRFEYYFLSPGMRLEARRMADYYKTDKHIIAALMSGFTQSMFYEPLYAPLFVINDTICIFNHYKDYLYRYNKQNSLIDSVKIVYHHPKNWREWKKQLFVDEPQNKVYAFFSKDGHHYLKQIDHRTGKEVLTYKLQHHSAEKIKIKDGYIYYVYRPFGSTQEKFLYREKIQ